jgi:hypothetical protein
MIQSQAVPGDSLKYHLCEMRVRIDEQTCPEIDQGLRNCVVSVLAASKLTCRRQRAKSTTHSSSRNRPRPRVSPMTSADRVTGTPVRRGASPTHPSRRPGESCEQHPVFGKWIREIDRDVLVASSHLTCSFRSYVPMIS